MSSDALKLLLSIPFEQADALENAGMTIHDIEMPVIEAIGKASSLRRLSWSSPELNHTAILRKFPWSQLTHFRFECLSFWDDALALAACCTSVVTMQIQCESLGLVCMAPSTLSFPHLRALDLSSNGTEIFGVVSYLWHCPRLQVLILSSKYWASQASAEEVLLSSLRVFSHYPLHFLQIHAQCMPNKLLPMIFTVSTLVKIPTFNIRVFSDYSTSTSAIISEIEANLAQHIPEKARSWKLRADARGSLFVGWVDPESVNTLQKNPELRDIVSVNPQLLL
ncbi:hypothetical protein D9756_009802 [Leucocoprinus leucothites]|uniref:Uncharacterized protein n=1 Tax=Leucocoprinus leucothites TaxID=201217 RepID=A0A8H5CVK3_9AGAR|nr:hypothetical protein D9756_009802 [Leucoagaricus leucothites]